MYLFPRVKGQLPFPDLLMRPGVGIHQHAFHTVDLVSALTVEMGVIHEGVKNIYFKQGMLFNYYYCIMLFLKENWKTPKEETE